MSRLLPILAISALLSSTPVLSHTAEYFDSIETAHGGQMRMAGPYHLELVIEGQQLRLYVTDHADTPQDATGLKARVVVLDQGRKASVALQVSDENHRLDGKLEFRPGQAVKAIAIVEGEHGSFQARFTPLSPPAASAAAPSDDGQADGHHRHDHGDGAQDHSGHHHH